MAVIIIINSLNHPRVRKVMNRAIYACPGPILRYSFRDERIRSDTLYLALYLLNNCSNIDRNYTALLRDNVDLAD